MSSTQYELIYFDGRGRAEIIRLIFAVAGVTYEDTRYAYDDTWPEVKKTLDLPFDQLPLLKADGVVLCQSLAIASFLAKRFGLAGKTDLEQVRADMIVFCVEDITNPIIDFMFYETDSAKQADRKQKFVEQQLPKYLKNLETLLKQNNGGDGFFVGDTITWADLHLLDLVDYLEFIDAGSKITEYEKLNALYQRVKLEPKVAAWLEKRPKSSW